MSLEYFLANPPLIELSDLKKWIIKEDDNLLIIDKPGWIVCHPSKQGPLSSLVGACREYTGIDTLHLVNRLDRETSGVVILAKNKTWARRCQMAFEQRRVVKTYYAILNGEMTETQTINKQLARDGSSEVYIKQVVRRSRTSQKAMTTFIPLVAESGYTLVKIIPITGRKHQIRAHAQWISHYIIGDKIYGPDENLYLEFIEKGWTRHLEYNLPHYRQALHAAQLTIQGSGYEINFWAPFPQDLVNFCEKKMGVTISELQDFGIYLVNNLRSKKSSQQEVNRLPNIMPNVSTKYP